MAKEGQITEETKVPLRFLGFTIAAAAGVLAAVVGVFFWGGRVDARAEAQGKEITALQEQQKQYGTDMRGVNESLIEIRTVLKLRQFDSHKPAE